MPVTLKLSSKFEQLNGYETAAVCNNLIMFVFFSSIAKCMGVLWSMSFTITGASNSFKRILITPMFCCFTARCNGSSL